MLIIVKVKDTNNIIGVKEDIATRLEGVVDIERIDVCGNNDIDPKLITTKILEREKRT